MRQIQLPRTDLKTSALGFGCANLMGRISRRQSLHALGLALDQGITYFDTARSYGWGKSESVLGQFAKGRRARLTLTTKLGILPPPRNFLLETARPIARSILSFASRYRLRNVTTFVRSQVVRHASSKVVGGQFDVRLAEQSLDCSLRTLRTDYVDILLLHGCTFNAVSGGEIFEFLDRSVAAGKIRYYGIASDLENSEQICDRFPRVLVVQLLNNLMERNLERFSQRKRLAMVTNTPLGGGKLIEAIAHYVDGHPEDARPLATNAGYDITTAVGIQRLLLSFALATNPNGVVVCGMHTDKNIRANATIAEQDASTDVEFVNLATAFGERLLACRRTEGAAQA